MPKKIDVPKWLERLKDISIDQKQELIDGLTKMVKEDKEKKLAELDEERKKYS